MLHFLQQAAADPRVLAIKQTLYRTGGDRRIVGALMDAVKNGKQVTVVVELKARFDEANNIAWSRRLEEAGVHVVYGVVGYKVHAKVCLVVRRDDDGLRRYVHLGTGNYNPSTARLYTDLSLLTCRPDVGKMPPRSSTCSQGFASSDPRGSWCWRPSSCTSASRL